MNFRLVRYVPRAWIHASPRVGVLLDDYVADVNEACDKADLDCGCATSVVDLLACPDCQEIARRALAEAGDDVPGLPLESARLLAPIGRPGKLLCVAGNYRKHIQEGGGQVHESDEATPRFFMKPSTNTVCGPGDPILVARTARFVDYEGEMALVIGRRGKYIKAEHALDYIGGVTCLNDISERSLHIWDRPEERPWDRFFDWLNGKWFDSFAPMGPCAVPLADLGDIGNLALTTRVNGEAVQQSNTSQLIFSPARLIEYISSMVTLEPGDIIATGTPEGVGKARGVALQLGDTVEVEIEGVGVLSNPVVAEP